MDPTDLEMRIKESIDKDLEPFAVVATAGNSLHFSFDTFFQESCNILNSKSICYTTL